MTDRTQLEGWLEEASLPVGTSRQIDDDGFWSIRMGAALVTLALDARTPGVLYVFAPLFSLGEAPPRGDFSEGLLALQLSGELPPGVMFGLDRESRRLVLTGRFSLRRLDAAAFDGLLHALLGAVPLLQEQLRALADEEEAPGPVPEVGFETYLHQKMGIPV